MMFPNVKSRSAVVEFFHTKGQAIAKDALEKLSSSAQCATPWYLQLLQGLGAWVSAIMLLLFIGLSWRLQSSGAYLGIGLVLIVAAFVMLRGIHDNFFVRQLAVVFSMVGSIALVVGLLDQKYGRSFEVYFPTLVFIVEMASFLLMNDPVRRFLAAGFAMTALYYLLMQKYGMQFVEVYVGLLIAANILLWQNYPKLALLKGNWQEPLKYAVLIAMLCMILATVPGRAFMDFWFHRRMSNISTTISVIAALSMAAMVFSILKSHVAATVTNLLSAYSLLGIVAVFSLYSPGILVALFVVLLGYAYTNRFVLGLGILFSIFFLSEYYYSLKLTLLEKSLVLMGTGLVLIAAAWALQKFMVERK